MAIQRIETKTGSVRWRLRLYLGMDPDTGKRLIHTQTFDRKGDAEARAAELKSSGPAGSRVVPSKKSLSAYLDHWFDNVKAGRVRARTLHDYRGMVRRYVQEPPEGTPRIGKMRLDKLHAGSFEALYGHLWREGGLSPRTLQFLHAILRQALGHAVETRVLARNPTDAVKPPRQAAEGGTPRKAMRAMTREEAARFLALALEDEYSALWTVLLMGGLRPGEAFGLHWEDVDLEAGRLHVQRSLTRRGVPKLCACGHPHKVHSEAGKGRCTEVGCRGCHGYTGAKGWRLVEPKTARARRVVVLPELATRALREHRKAQAQRRLLVGEEWKDNGLVFTATFGTPLDSANLYRRFKALLVKAGLGAFRLYDLRHTGATLLLLAGENPKVVSERLGHASITLTLDTYSHVLPSMQEASAEKLQAMFRNA